MMSGDALRAAGAFVHIAGDGAEAVRLAGIVQPTVVLMDIQMPVMDGLEATRRLKADPATRHIPVLAVSALAMNGDRERILDAGCDGYLAKPVDPAELLMVVAAMAEDRVEPT
jgi:two-component system cell cycle response regulator DivK